MKQKLGCSKSQNAMQYNTVETRLGCLAIYEMMSVVALIGDIGMKVKVLEAQVQVRELDRLKD